MTSCTSLPRMSKRTWCLHNWKQQGLQVLVFGKYGKNQLVRTSRIIYCKSKDVLTYLKVMPGMRSNRPLWEGGHDPLIQPWMAPLFSHAPTTLREKDHESPSMERAMYRNASITYLPSTCSESTIKISQNGIARVFWHLPNVSRIWSGCDHQDEDAGSTVPQKQQCVIWTSSGLYEASGWRSWRSGGRSGRSDASCMHSWIRQTNMQLKTELSRCSFHSEPTNNQRNVITFCERIYEHLKNCF